jgi:hypothetical protein
MREVENLVAHTENEKLLYAQNLMNKFDKVLLMPPVLTAF